MSLNRWGQLRLWVVIALFSCLAVDTAPAQLPLQGSNQVPDLAYYAVFLDYYQGDYRGAARGFTSGSNALRFGQDYYLDSVCYRTMAGECQFHTGNFAAAIDFYESALSLYLDYARVGWQQRIQIPPAITARNGAAQAAQITWGQSRRNFTIAGLPDSLQVMFGRLDNLNVLQRGGVIQNPEFRPVDVAEIMRCTALALHRRRWIKGVTCKYDSLSTEIVETLGPSGGGDGSLLGAWNGIVLGVAQAGVEDFEQAKTTLLQALQFGGGMDHPLTPMGLLELATISVQTGDLDNAAQYALEASYSAAIYNQFDLLEESLALGTTIHLARSRTEFPPLQPAIVWASRNRARLAQVSLTIRLAECYSEAGDSARSAPLLSEAAKGAQRFSPASNPLLGRIGYLAALNQFLEGQFEAGRQQLGEGLERFQTGSRWLYQLALADSLSIKKRITDRQADLLYAMLLRDPLNDEWRLEPIEAMSFLASNHLEPIERWFEIAVANKDLERAIEIAELLKRHRFYSTIPLGGRQMAFRWVMHGPETAVGKDVLTQRADFITRFPEYKQWVDRADQLQQTLLTTPLKTEPDTDEQKQQLDSFVELMKVSQAQESALASLALRREPARMSFPPQLVISSARNEISSNQTIIYTVATSNAIYFFSITAQGVKLLSWQSGKRVATDINQIFREANLGERQFDDEMLKNDQWKPACHKVAATWLPQLNLTALDSAGELIIIPDGILWYAPFELLQIGPTPEQAKSLFELGAIRYSPTLGLAVEPQRPYKPWTRTAVFSGPLSNKFENEWTQARVQEYQKQSPMIANFDERLEIPSSLYTSVVDQVVVWTESTRGQRGGPYALVPLEKDRGKNGSNLAAWMSLPIEGAEHVVLPCFAGDGENGVKNNADGHEYFLTTCGLLASGARTLLISRWNVGGESTLEVTRKYLDNVAADITPVQAWHVAAQTMPETLLDWSKETRLKPNKTPPELKAVHPFFWSGYMLIDVPTTRKSNDPAAEKSDQAVTTPEKPATDAALPDPNKQPPPKIDKQLPKDK